MYTSLNQYHVVLEVEPRFQSGPDALRGIYLNSSAGQQVPLSTLVNSTTTAAPIVVNHQGMFPSTTISFNLKPGVALGDAVAAIHGIEQQSGKPASLVTSFQGNANAFTSALSGEVVLVLAALVVIYIILGVLYESLIHPITILSTLPSAGIGALLLLMAAHIDLSVIAVVGIILLIGIVKKNGIMLVDFALHLERSQGLDPEQSIYQACVLPVPADPDDDHGGAARRRTVDARIGHGRGDPPAARLYDRRRLAAVTDVDAVHDARGLSLPRPAGTVVQGAPGFKQCSSERCVRVDRMPRNGCRNASKRHLSDTFNLCPKMYRPCAQYVQCSKTPGDLEPAAIPPGIKKRRQIRPPGPHAGCWHVNC
jgi:hypothetical protein